MLNLPLADGMHAAKVGVLILTVAFLSCVQVV